MKKGQKKRTKQLEKKIIDLYNLKKEGKRVYSLHDIGRKVNLTAEGVRYILKVVKKT